ENAEREARDDFVRFQLSELEELGFQEGEWERLEVERRLLRDAESLLEVAQQGEQALYGGANAAVEQLTVGLRAARRLAEVDPQLSPLVAELQTALVAAEEAGRDLGTYARGLHQDPT
ncbi:MAG TPA: DNA repair protein RecN, partial [Deltaproteobacteria bacterium]|nr:DNA repair protein RecN [Deltaproteobacteria bacterium]